jgi:hypothetical protein
MDGTCSTNGRDEKCINISVVKPEMKSPLGRPWLRWEDNILMYLREIGWAVVDWMRLDQDREEWWAPVNTVMNFLSGY